MVELALQIFTLLLALAAVVIVAVILHRQKALTATVTPEIVAQLVRAECEAVRQAGEDNSRNLRTELSESFEKFREGVATSFRTILDYMSSQLREFDGRLERCESWRRMSATCRKYSLM
jgi:hypothetical protein